MGHTTFTTPTDRTVHVLGQLQHFNQIYKLLLGNRIIVNTNASHDLSNLLRDYMNLRKAERSDWSRYGQQKGSSDDLKAVSKAVAYLKEHELFTLEDLDTALRGVNEKARAINADMKKASARMKVITGIQNAVADCQTHKAVHDKRRKSRFRRICLTTSLPTVAITR